MKYPESALTALEQELNRLDYSHGRIWGVLSPSPERDEILWHILSAKVGIRRILKEHKKEEN